MNGNDDQTTAESKLSTGKKTTVKNKQQHKTKAVHSEQKFLAAWFRHHSHSAKDSLSRLLVSPVSSFLTWMVIGIALALPAILYITLTNIEDISSQWDNGTRISLFLSRDIDDQQGQSIAEKLLARSDVVKAEYVSSSAAMKFFKANSGLGVALQNIDQNPFPASVELQYVENISPSKVRTLIKDLRDTRGVESVQLDMDWVQRLYRFMQLGKRLTVLLICLLSLGVLLVVGNTIKLGIENRREEIVIVKLVGGSDRFVRRPFLYSGFWYGLGGGVIAWLTILTTRSFLQEPVGKLMKLYDSNFQLLGLSLGDTLGLIFCGVLLGWLGAWLAVSHHLSEIEPR